MYSIKDFDYQLPEERIANKPTDPRDSSRLLVLDRQTGKTSHKHFYDLPDLLDENTVVVRNNTKVIPARIFAKKPSGGALEVLLLKRVGIGRSGEIWEVLTKPGLKIGQQLQFEGSELRATCVEVLGYTRHIEFNMGKEELFAQLEKIGHTPIPPYIKWANEDEANLREIYQTIYAKHKGSAAAPTAGLHFTTDLEKKLQNRGVKIEEVTLHVGLGTFLPVKSEDITEHAMHAEYFELDEQTAKRLNRYKKAGKKILSVGTTTTRVLESCAKNDGLLKAGKGETSIFIYPPYKFKFVDQIITNFHLPKSTLLMMIGAFVSAPNTDHEFKDFLSSSVGQAYLEAIEKEYRFYSFGDGMLIK